MSAVRTSVLERAKRRVGKYLSVLRLKKIGYCVSFPGLKRAGCGVKQPPQPALSLKNNISTPSRPSWPFPL
jgi:hypothetical protein